MWSLPSSEKNENGKKFTGGQGDGQMAKIKWKEEQSFQLRWAKM